ncbi:DUF692 domain-containing protein [Wenzhouxiangella sp. XN24]|uniref:HvfB family MNIO-type RiPP peptide maturase n=1 Tax=Wenzhouxiangella sp. XN24 TaxID=2713569 RepID=UPI0013EE3129|nr:DUF692 domain-containing protein [Wenzhouxiangella sp. XN24]NGX15557.1 DUF692 domain-containing protein [Wenzhouxiangella sp. XN24]
MNKLQEYPVEGVGLGLRRSMMDELMADPPWNLDFMEVAPENWIGVGGALGRKFCWFTDRFPFVVHGLSLSLGGPAPLDEYFLERARGFLDAHGVRFYTEHLSYTGDEGHLYDLMPIPFTEEAVRHVAGRIRRAAEILERPIAVENVSYYAAPGQEMAEADFLRAVLEEADCGLLLDVNNVYVNAINHGYDPEEFLAALPGERVVYLHVAGHYVEAEDLRVDTHGADVADPVWGLLDRTYARFGVIPTLLERDFNIPPMAQLQRELDIIRGLQKRHAGG